jgi:hypothetical protein
MHISILHMDWMNRIAIIINLKGKMQSDDWVTEEEGEQISKEFNVI